MKITKSQLQRIIREVLEEEKQQELDEATMEQAKVQAPLRSLHANLVAAKDALGKSGAKKSISELLQNAGPGSDVTDKAQKLLKAVVQLETGIDTIMKWINSTQGSTLTKDPWAHVGKRD